MKKFLEISLMKLLCGFKEFLLIQMMMEILIIQKNIFINI